MGNALRICVCALLFALIVASAVQTESPSQQDRIDAHKSAVIMHKIKRKEAERRLASRSSPASHEPAVADARVAP